MAPKVTIIVCIISHLLAFLVSGFSLDCATNLHACKDTIIQCAEDEDCFIACNEEQSCMYSRIICPSHADCTIECDGWQSCHDTIIDATYSTSGNLNILCQGSTDHCLGINIYGSILYNNNGNMNLLCNGELQSCMESHVRCPVSGNCYVSCNADKSCQYANITGPINGDLSIDCNHYRSCFGAVFDGTKAQHMDISGCITQQSCFDLSVKCPPNTNHTTKCFIQGNDNIGGDTTLYAVHGWKDIQIAYNGDYGEAHGGTMFCGVGYNEKCDIASGKWLCDDDTHYCNDVYVTRDINDININGTMPHLDDGFESEGMLLIVGGLIALAVGCIVMVVIQHLCCKIHKQLKANMHNKSKYQQPPKRIKSEEPRRIEAIIIGDEPSYEDSRGNIHHQHSMHERTVSSLHDLTR